MVLQEKENKKSKVMREALAAAQQLAKEAKSKNRGRVLSEIHAKISNKINCAEEYGHDQNLPKNEKVDFQATATNVAEGAQPVRMKQRNTCDAHTSLTAESYFEEFKMVIPLVNDQGTQTRFVIFHEIFYK